MQAEEQLPTRQRPAPMSYAPQAAFRSSRVMLLVAAYATGLMLFLAIEPTQPWILLAVTAIVAVGADGVLRQHPLAAREEDTAWTAPLLFLPALFTLSSGLFLEDVVGGYRVVPGVLIGSVIMAVILFSEQISVDLNAHNYPAARFALNIATYVTAFGFYAVVYAFDVSLVPAAITVGLVSMLLAVEVLREAEADPIRALVFAGVVGLILAEARWALYFLPIVSYLAATFLLLVFYLVSGLVQHHLNNDLRMPVVIEFVVIASFGVFIVIMGRLLEAGA